MSAFRMNIFFVVLIITGIAITPLLSLQFNPTRYLPSLTISFSWPNVPVRMVEQEVTTAIEGVLSTVSGITRIRSVTREGIGSITVEFDRRTDLQAKRFEVASLMKEAFKRLPEGVSYPSVRMNLPAIGSSGSLILSYQITGNTSQSYIADVAEELIKPAIATIDGVYSVDVYGSTPREWEITYDLNKLSVLGLQPTTLTAAIKNYMLERELGGGHELTTERSVKKTYITLAGNRTDTIKWYDIPITSISGRIVTLGDVATVRLKDRQPVSYYRINGLNTINLNVTAAKNVNNIKVAGEVKKTIEKIKKELPPGYSIRNSLDNTVFIRQEISKNLFRTVLSVVLLLLFIFAITREFHYLLIIAISLFSNILIAFIFYYLFHLEIHLYSLAGITVSFGIIINNTIVIVDHLRHRRNMKVGISLLAATLTTIGALSVIFFLDEDMKLTLSDFAAVVIINLSVSLVIALFFIPALMEKIRLKSHHTSYANCKKRAAVKFTHQYKNIIDFIIQRRTALIIMAILVFGLPVIYLPDRLPPEQSTIMQEEQLTWLQKLYNKSLGNPKYVQKFKPAINKVLGGTLRLFSEKVKNSRFYYYGSSGEVQRTQITVDIGLSEPGLTVENINNICMRLENMLAEYDEIDLFTTTVYSAEDATVTVTFKPEYDFTVFPYILKFKIEDFMNSIGSYHTIVYGVGKAFSNQVYSDYIRGTYTIIMRGYNYDELYNYCEGLKERLIKSARGRIKEVFFLASSDRFNVRKNYRNTLLMDRSYLAAYDADIVSTYAGAYRLSGNSLTAGNVYTEGFIAPISLKTLQAEEFDYWNFINEPILIRNGMQMKLKDFAGVVSEVSDNTISREDQEYVIYVTYDFIGNYELGRMILERNVKETNSLLPLGYTAQISTYSFSWGSSKANYLLIFLVVLIIWIVCSILFESLKQPLIVISLIPFSLIGVFLTFFIFNINPDEGVFAAMILLCGIVVNSSIYILGDYNSLRREKPGMDERRLYLKAFNGKIIPVILTIFATIMGLIPFLLTGRDERFWFNLAAGTIGGLIFSIVGLLFYQPLMLKKKGR
ncbi:MAG TPA: efflux RND transporter permease subunit [Bacteroidales bacterium]|nr:efflux RND transporter permease subunit [Bacteroidales bacterium]HOK74320.1 efflux RND transporter permease subunit [Bacteroidales bacterium]HOM39842.1 efflux RND transporter permease subunit [Bacteroidales bacterium]HPP92784.1 efflux RND transporter permease subunit [Bacteroidales bacterium]